MRQAWRLVPRGNRETDGMAAHAVRPEIGGLPVALLVEHADVGRADRVACCPFAGLLIPFISHAVIVADMRMPPGRKTIARPIPPAASGSRWQVALISITPRER